jgi:hypothetical protein
MQSFVTIFSQLEGIATSFNKSMGGADIYGDKIKTNMIEAKIEAEKYGEKTFEYKGMTFTRVDGRSMYKYDHLPMWNALKEEMKDIEEKSKSSARNQQIGVNSVDDDGVVIDPCIITYTKPSLSVKFKF